MNSLTKLAVAEGRIKAFTNQVVATYHAFLKRDDKPLPEQPILPLSQLFLHTFLPQVARPAGENGPRVHEVKFKQYSFSLGDAYDLILNRVRPGDKPPARPINLIAPKPHRSKDRQDKPGFVPCFVREDAVLRALRFSLHRSVTSAPITDPDFSQPPVFVALPIEQKMPAFSPVLDLAAREAIKAVIPTSDRAHKRRLDNLGMGDPQSDAGVARRALTARLKSDSVAWLGSLIPFLKRVLPTDLSMDEGMDYLERVFQATRHTIWDAYPVKDGMRSIPLGIMSFADWDGPAPKAAPFVDTHRLMGLNIRNPIPDALYACGAIDPVTYGNPAQWRRAAEKQIVDATYASALAASAVENLTEDLDMRKAFVERLASEHGIPEENGRAAIDLLQAEPDLATGENFLFDLPRMWTTQAGLVNIKAESGREIIFPAVDKITFSATGWPSLSGIGSPTETRVPQRNANPVEAAPVRELVAV
jgi:hypothetical protein